MRAIEKKIGQTVETVFEQATEPTIQAVRCPNCGSFAERYHAINHQRIHTQCNQCDYLMTTCSLTGRVIEAYAPGIPFGARVPGKAKGPKAIETLEVAHTPRRLLNL